MELEFKKDFDEARKNWRLFWDGKLNRPIIPRYLTAFEKC